MSVVEKWLDAAYPGTAQQFIGALQAAGAQGFAWYLGGDDALHAWDIGVVRDVEAAGFHGLAVYVPFLDHTGAADGADAVRLAQAAGLRAAYPICLDLEPGVFAAHPISVDQAYADAFNQQLRAAGFRPITYGTPATLAAISNYADAIWAAVPGQPDPEAIGLNPTFFEGKRSVQWAAGMYSGVHADVSNSQYSLATLAGGGGGLITEGDTNTMLIQVGNGNAYIVGESGKRHISASELFTWNAAGVKQTNVTQAEADAIPDVPVPTPGPVGPQGPPGPAGAVPAHDHVIPTGVTEPFTP